MCIRDSIEVLPKRYGRRRVPGQLDRWHQRMTDRVADTGAEEDRLRAACRERGDVLDTGRRRIHEDQPPRRRSLAEADHLTQRRGAPLTHRAHRFLFHRRQAALDVVFSERPDLHALETCEFLGLGDYLQQPVRDLRRSGSLGQQVFGADDLLGCLLYTSPSPRD